MARLALLVAAGAVVGVVGVLGGGNVRGYCHSRGALPDVRCTPGLAAAQSRAVVCAAGYNPPGPGRRAIDVILRTYGISPRHSARYRVEALVPLRLGGSRRKVNLWPLALAGHPGVPEKDRLDSTLRSMACAGRLSVPAAQHDAASNWVSAYQRVVPPAARPHP
jgi:hypothetical protein